MLGFQKQHNRPDFGFGGAWFKLPQNVTVCCSVLQCVAVCCSVCCSDLVGPGLNSTRRNCPLQCVALCCSVLQCVAVCVEVFWWGLRQTSTKCTCMLQCTAVCCSICCSVLVGPGLKFLYRSLFTYVFFVYCFSQTKIRC